MADSLCDSVRVCVCVYVCVCVFCRAWRSSRAPARRGRPDRVFLRRPPALLAVHPISKAFIFTHTLNRRGADVELMGTLVFATGPCPLDRCPVDGKGHSRRGRLTQR
ncbi:hypothetical protein LY76DRAFT_223869 [Colletotrichum caudatum]|nr:hypothetical protein LY76DRAFT_223869 [Colletotrichum caudatum]